MKHPGPEIPPTLVQPPPTLVQPPPPPPLGSGAAACCYLLNRLFLDTMRRKPVGSVTELSLLLSSSNCWSSRSPASLSVSLLEPALADRRTQNWMSGTCAHESRARAQDLSEAHAVTPTHTLGLISQARSNTLT